MSDSPEKKVLLGFNGSVDSVVSAFILQKQGFEVTALTILNWDASSETSAGVQAPDCHVQDQDLILKICEELKISHYFTNNYNPFEANIVSSSVERKVFGLRPKSCVLCHRSRFEILAEKATKLKIPFISTGHYGRVSRNIRTGESYIDLPNDRESDQTRFLAGIPQVILQRLILPLADLKRSEVEKIVKRFSLSVARREHITEGPCFDRDKGMKEYILSHVPETLRSTGQFIHPETMAFLGDHEGIPNYYWGESGVLNNPHSSAQEKAYRILKFEFNTGQVLLGPDEYMNNRGAMLFEVELASFLDRSRPQNVVISSTDGSISEVDALLLFKSLHACVLETVDPVPFSIGLEIIIYLRVGNHLRVAGRGEVGKAGEYNKVDRLAEYREEEDIEDDEDDPISKMGSF